MLTLLELETNLNLFAFFLTPKHTINKVLANADDVDVDVDEVETIVFFFHVLHFGFQTPDDNANGIAHFPDKR